VKNYEFDFNFGGAWGNCSVTMTSVLGHLTGLDFDRQYKGWLSCPPGSLFEAPVQEAVDKVGDLWLSQLSSANVFSRISYQSQKTFATKPGTPRHCSSGLIVIVKANTSVLKSVTRRRQAMLALKSSEPSSVTQKARESEL
jgi:hypothetical protein